MPVLPTDITLGNSISSLLMKASNWVGSRFSHPQFSSDYALDSIALIDERLRPQAPMPKDDIEIMTRLNLSNMGLRNAQQVTAESHPELYSAWRTLCQRAGYGNKVPQLIMTESQTANAMEITDNEMVITSGLLKMLTLREVVAVLGHELGHGRHDHTSVRVTSLGLFSAAGALAGNFVGKMGGTDPHGVARDMDRGFMAMLGPFGRWINEHFLTQLPHTDTPRPASLLGYAMYIAGGALLGQVAANQISVKPTELQADLDGVAISGDAEALASALSKMQASDPRGAFSRWLGYLKSGYPTVDERVDNIRRAASELPPNPVPAVLGPVPVARPRPQVNGVALGERVAAPDMQALLG